MRKWHENVQCDNGIIISSRVRLARNLKKYPFSIKLSNEKAESLLEEIKGSIQNDRTSLASQFKYFDMKSMKKNDKEAMMEHHLISPMLMQKENPCAVLIMEDETISIMLNEEDHIRIQAVFEGDNIKKAWDLADKMDNLIEETVEYAFDEDFGYLTSCPTNAGTGLRASYMMHLPALERTGQIKNVSQAVSKLGITVRGTYGEGSEALGAIYQVSNQVTLGVSEEEIISKLEKVAGTILDQERRLQKSAFSEAREIIEDRFFRSYGILTNARRISSKEAMSLLSNLREGYNLGIEGAKKPDKSMYTLMMDIQRGSIENMDTSNNNRDIFRAGYIRSHFRGETPLAE